MLRGICKLLPAFFMRHGGWRAFPALLRKFAVAFSQGGVAGLCEKIKRYGASVDPGEEALPKFSDSVQGRSPIIGQTGNLIRALPAHRWILIVDHMYGGGANAYRINRTRELLAGGRAVLVATWSYYTGRMILRFHLPGNEQPLSFQATGLPELLAADFLSFDQVILNSLHLWALPGPEGAPDRGIRVLLESLLNLKERSGATLEFCLHDYYPVCPVFTLLDAAGTYCHVPRDMKKCHSCLKRNRTFANTDTDLKIWRQAWQQFFDSADQVRAFAFEPLGIFRQVFQIAAELCVVVPHKSLLQVTKKYCPPATGPMKIVVLGEIQAHKGAHIVCELAGMLNEGEEIIVLGTIDALTPRKVTVHGRYTREELPALVAHYQPTVALIPSIWPETFCYTAQECEILGLPTVAFPLGAQAERVKAAENGLTAADVSASAALRALRSLDARRLSGGATNRQCSS